MLCANCGKQNPEDSKFCENCGSPLAESTAKATPVAAAFTAPPPPQQQPVYAAPPVQQQTFYQQPSQPIYNAAPAAVGAKVMSIGSYILTFILTGIPLVGFILLLVWSFGSDVNPNKKNFCRAVLIMMVVGIILGIIFGGAIYAFIAGMIENGDFNFNY
jgi:hypothetical protein